MEQSFRTKFYAFEGYFKRVYDIRDIDLSEDKKINSTLANILELESLSDILEIKAAKKDPMMSVACYTLSSLPNISPQDFVAAIKKLQLALTSN